VDASQVLVPDSTKPEDDEELDVDGWFDGSVTALGSVLLPNDVFRSVEVSECLRDWIFHG